MTKFRITRLYRPSICPAVCLLIVATLSLAGCTSPEPWTLAQSSDAITLRWYADTVPTTAADGVAGAHCAALGRSAELGSIEHDGSAVIGHFRCT